MWLTIIVGVILLLVIITLSFIIFFQQQKIKKELNDKLSSVVDQINDSQMYGFKFDKQQDENIQNNDKNLSRMHKLVSTVETNQKYLDSVTAKKEDIKKQITSEEVKANTIVMGNKFTLNGLSSDDWLRMTDSSRKNYYGGIATSKIYTDKAAYLNGVTSMNNAIISNNAKIGHSLSGWIDNSVLSTVAKGGKIGASFGGEDNLWSHFPYNENTYIRPGKNQGKVFIGDIGASSVEIGNSNSQTNIKGVLNTGQVRFTPDNSDPYKIEKVVRRGNSSSLRMTINDDPDESFEVYADSCRTGNCQGSGRQRFVVKADGQVQINGKLKICDDQGNQCRQL